MNSAVRNSANRPNSTNRRRIKRSLARRDGQACFYCTRPFADLADATLDHFVPFTVCPTWKIAALVLACGPCNRAKADRLPQTLMRPTGFGPGLVTIDAAPRDGRTRRVRSAVRSAVHRVKDRTAAAAPVGGPRTTRGVRPSGVACGLVTADASPVHIVARDGRRTRLRSAVRRVSGHAVDTLARDMPPLLAGLVSVAVSAMAHRPSAR